MIKTGKLFLGILLSIAVLSCIALPAAGEEKDTKGEVPVVADGKSVKVHYTLTVEGKVVDSSKGREPLEFKAGSKQMIPGFEKALMGMKKGDKKSFQVSPDEGYGAEDPKGIQEVPKDKLPPDVKPEPGMTLQAQGQDGRSYPVRIVEVKGDVVVMNFNHPLAGKTLSFDVEVIEVN